MTSLHFSFIFAADFVHLSAFALLAGWIVHKKTCRGISGRTQALSALVNWLQFAYTAFGRSIFREGPEWYMTVVSGLQAAESCVLLFLIYAKYKKTVEKSYDTFWVELVIILGVSFSLTYNSNKDDPLVVLYYCSRYLDGGSFVPQIYFNFRTGSKALPVSLFVLLSTISTCLYVYYSLTQTRHFLNAINVKSISDYLMVPALIKIGSSLLFWIMLIVVPKHKEVVPFSEVDSISHISIDSSREGDYPPPIVVVTRPQLARQQSRLETPFLKKSLPSSNSLTSAIMETSSRNSPYPTRRPLKLSISTFYSVTKMSMKRSPGTSTSLKSFAMSSETNTPDVESKDDSFIFMTAQQSRKRRMAFRRQSSLPDTRVGFSGIEISGGEEGDELQVEKNKVQFEIGADDSECSSSIEKAVCCNTESSQSWQLKHQTIQEAPNFISVHPTSNNKTKDRGTEHHNVVQTNNEVTSTESKNVAMTDFQKLEMSGQKGSGKGKPARKRVDTRMMKTTGKKSVTEIDERRASMYVGNSLQQKHNWKSLASNFIGTSPIYERRFSELGESSPHWKIMASNYVGTSPTLSYPVKPADRHKTNISNSNQHKRRRTIWHL